VVVLGCPHGDEDLVLQLLLEEPSAPRLLVRLGVFDDAGITVVESYAVPVSWGAAPPVLEAEEHAEWLRAIADGEPVVVWLQDQRVGRAALVAWAVSLSALPGVRILVAEPVVSKETGAALAEGIGAQVLRPGGPSFDECRALAQNVLGGPVSARLLSWAWSAAGGRRALIVAAVRDGLEQGVLQQVDEVWTCSTVWAAPGEHQRAAWDAVRDSLSPRAVDAVELCALTRGLPLSSLAEAVGVEGIDEAIAASCLCMDTGAGRWVSLGGMVADRAIVALMPPGRARELRTRFLALSSPPQLSARLTWRWSEATGEVPGGEMRAAAALGGIADGQGELVLETLRGSRTVSEPPEELLTALIHAENGQSRLVREAAARLGWFGVQGERLWLQTELLRLAVEAEEGVPPLRLEREFVAAVADFHAGVLPSMQGVGEAQLWISRVALVLGLRHGVSEVNTVAIEPGAGPAGAGERLARARWLFYSLVRGGVDAGLEALDELHAEVRSQPPSFARSGVRRYACLARLISGDRSAGVLKTVPAADGLTRGFGPDLPPELWDALLALESGDTEEALQVLESEVAQARVTPHADEAQLAFAALALVRAVRGETAEATRLLSESAQAPRATEWAARQYAGVLAARAWRILGHVAQARTSLLELVQAEDQRRTATLRFMVLAEAARWEADGWESELLTCAQEVDSSVARALAAGRAAAVAGRRVEAEHDAAVLRRLGRDELARFVAEAGDGGGVERRRARGATEPDSVQVLSVRLTERQLDVARRASTGRSSAEIAEVLGITTRTAESHLQQIYTRLNLHSRAELADWLKARGL